MSSPIQRQANEMTGAAIQTARVEKNVRVCREHYRLTLRAERFAAAYPGQFVHLRAEGEDGEQGTPNERFDGAAGENRHRCRSGTANGPLLRRAFSIAGLRREDDAAFIDVIYRVVGEGTRWMATLRERDWISVLGPAGNCFPIISSKPVAWLVAGGVGLPPMLWLAEALQRAGHRAIAICGAQNADLLPLTLDAAGTPVRDATRAVAAAQEFARCGADVVISTDDGSLGFPGHVGAAMEAYHRANPIGPNKLVVYTCGPEPMLECVATYCVQRGIECYVCMERRMACGTGLCQSCVIRVRDEKDPDGWSYRLCCTDGPVFDAAEVIWSA